MVSNIGLSVMAWVSALRGTIVEMIHDDERGQDLMEYAVLVGAIAVVAGAAMYVAGFDFTTFTNKIQDCLNFDKAACG